MNDDILLVRRIKQGEHGCFSELVERYQKPLYRYLRRLGLEHDEAADVMQNAFIRAWNNLSTLHEEGNFRSWLYTIASNQAKNWFRGRSRLAVLEQSSDNFLDENADSDREMDREKMRHWLDGALNRLPAVQRQIVVLRAFEDTPFAAVAEICGVSLTAAKVSYHRALKKMAVWLKPVREQVNMQDGR
ncbi:RNA polymerase sigma factor [bacterium]|nr:RNA polymerase sigma factor [bacterium]